jgi:hypothetical protein
MVGRYPKLGALFDTRRSVDLLKGNASLNVAIYPGGGVEASLGPVGLRLELGDEIYFNKGAHNNLRITFGPILRF